MVVDLEKTKNYAILKELNDLDKELQTLSAASKAVFAVAKEQSKVRCFAAHKNSGGYKRIL